MTEGRGQVFSALELGPGCLVLGISGGPSLGWKVQSCSVPRCAVPSSLLQGWEELVEGLPGASKWRDTRWTALEMISMSTFLQGLAVITPIR